MGFLRRTVTLEELRMNRCVEELTKRSGSDHYEIEQIDIHGPGFVGWWLDNRSTLVSQTPVIITVDGVILTDEHPEYRLLNSLLSHFRNQLETQVQIFFRLARILSTYGEVWIGRMQNYGWSVWARKELSVYKDSPYAVNPVTGEKQPVEIQKRWIPSPHNFMVPYTPLTRAIPEIRRYRSAVHAQVADADSRLVSNGMLFFPEEGYTQTGARAAEQKMTEYVRLAQARRADQRYLPGSQDPSTLAPFPMTGPPPNHVTLARRLDSVLIELEKKALEAFARAVNIPLKLLVEGPGTAKYSNEDAIIQAYIRDDIQPLVNHIIGMIEDIYLRPTVQRANEMGICSVAAERVGLLGHAQDLLESTERPELILEAYKLGIVDAETVGRALSVPVVKIMPKVSSRPIPASSSQLDAVTAAASDTPEAKIERDRKRLGEIDKYTKSMYDRLADRLKPGPDETLAAAAERQGENIDQMINQFLDQNKGGLKNILSEPGDDNPFTEVATLLWVFLAMSWLNRRKDRPYNPDAVVPSQIAVDTALAAAGATVGPAGVSRDVHGVPLGPSGRWDRGFGPATRNVSAEKWVWRHSFWRVPKNPYEPHLALNGKKVSSSSPEETGGYFPGDHPHCTCALVPLIGEE